MTKNIYNKNQKRYYYTYYCDSCFKIIINGEINRSDKAIENNIFDLCSECARRWEND